MNYIEWFISQYFLENNLSIEAHGNSIGTFHAKIAQIKSIVNLYNGYHKHISFNYQNLEYLLYGIVVLIFILNLHIATVNFSKFIFRDVESNPGPKLNIIGKAVLATCHQGQKKYGVSAGMQCPVLPNFSVIFPFFGNKTSYRWSVFN